MKVHATVVLSFRPASLADAGAVLDDVLARAPGRDDVDAAWVEHLRRHVSGSRGTRTPDVLAGGRRRSTHLISSPTLTFASRSSS
jgi:hypothetical protein